MIVNSNSTSISVNFCNKWYTQIFMYHKFAYIPKAINNRSKSSIFVLCDITIFSIVINIILLLLIIKYNKTY